MKRNKLSAILVALLCIFALAACAKAEPQPLQPQPTPAAERQAESKSLSADKAESSPESPAAAEDDWGKAIGNARYNFFVTIPHEWQAVDRSENGDGYFIECENSNIDMRVYGANYLPELGELNGLVGKPFAFTGGVQGLINIDDGILTCSYLSEDETSVISFYIDYSGDPAWFEKNEETVMLVAQSLRNTEICEYPLASQ